MAMNLEKPQMHFKLYYEYYKHVSSLISPLVSKIFAYLKNLKIYSIFSIFLVVLKIVVLFEKVNRYSNMDSKCFPNDVFIAQDSYPSQECSRCSFM